MFQDRLFRYAEVLSKREGAEIALDCGGEGRVDPGGKALSLLVDLDLAPTYGNVLWIAAERRIEGAEMWFLKWLTGLSRRDKADI